MATIQIYRKNNYIILIDNKNDKYEEHYSNVYVQRNGTNENLYDILLMRFDTVIKNFYAIAFTEIKQENNSSFATAELWEDWYTSNTGFNNAGSISTDVNANLKVGGTNVSSLNPVPVNIVSGGGSITTAGIEIYKIVGTTTKNVAANALSISVQNIGNFNIYANVLGSGVTYIGDYNNGLDYAIGDVVSIPEGSPYGTAGELYIRVSNPNNPGFPPGTASWQLYTNTGEVATIDAGISVTWDAPSNYKLPAFTFTNATATGSFLLTVVK